jgi:hypothetical protein
MTSSAAVAARPGARFRLGRHPRRVALVVHLASAGGWLGIDIAMAVVIVTATTTRDAATRTSCLLVLELITVWPLLGCGLACLLSGLVLGLGSKWGVLRYWWVAVKLALNLVLTGLVVLSLRFEVGHQAALARRAAAGEAVDFDFTNLIYPPTVSPTLLLVAMTLSVVKPWGQIRRRAPRRARRGDGAGRARTGRRTV